MKKNGNTLKEKGAVLLETALALPFLIYIAFMGFELTRLSELQLAKRDIIRVMSLSHVCGFRQPQAAARCFEESINRVVLFTKDRFPQMQVYIQTYTVNQPSISDQMLGGQRGRIASNSCSQEGGADLSVSRIASSPLPPGFNTKFGSVDNGKLKDVVTQNTPNFSDIRMQFCLNGQITIAEFNVNRTPLFGSLGALVGGSSSQETVSRANLHYEFGAI